MEPSLLPLARMGLVGPSVDGDDAPQGIAYRLTASLDAQCCAVLQTLIYADASPGAQPLTVGLIEAWIHLDFVWSAGRPRAECRALSLELGWASGSELANRRTTMTRLTVPKFSDPPVEGEDSIELMGSRLMRGAIQRENEQVAGRCNGSCARDHRHRMKRRSFDLSAKPIY